LQFGEVLGLIAGAITTGSFVPQVIRVYKLKSAREISLLFTFLYVAGGLLWLSYGVYLHSFPIMFWNIIAFLLSLALLIGKLRYGKGNVAIITEDKPKDK
jgi:MtN3 and saliva related transmembrane protein